MAAAMELGHYFLVHAQICYGFMGVDESTENAGYILGRLKKHKPEQFTARDLLKLCKKIKTTSDLTESLAMLIEHGFIRESQPAYTGTGRPQGIIYSVNPKLYKE